MKRVNLVTTFKDLLESVSKTTEINIQDLVLVELFEH